MIAMKRTYIYLQATKDLKIIYHSGLIEKPGLEIYTDSDGVYDKEIRKSTSGYIAILARCYVSWSFKLESIVAQLSKEAEYIAASKATKEAV